MKEEFLHYIWRYGLFDSRAMITGCGKNVEVLFAGRYNQDAGPDFLEARLLIDNVIWIGHVEIHVKASDWKLHGHQDDHAYDPVILHVVYKDNCEVRNSMGSLIPSLRLRFRTEYYEKYLALVNDIRPVPCGTKWHDHSPVKIENAVISMGIGRMESRLENLHSKLDEKRGAMKELFVQTISRGFGFGKNQEPMEQVGRSVNPIWLEKHSSNLFQLESIFFGQAGFIPEKSRDTYLSALRTEYSYLSRKYNMTTPAWLRWKYLRMRPGNFPAVRMAQLCSFFHGKGDLVRRIVDLASECNIDRIETRTSAYWKTHYDIGKRSSARISEMGPDSKLLLMINVVLPLASFYNRYTGTDQTLDPWLEKLEALPPENNHICRKWEEIGFRIPNAFYSQAFLHIYRNYCTTRNCLNCRIGHILLGKKK